MREDQGDREWTLHQLGNWAGFRSDATDGGTWDLDQGRSHNKANEIDDEDHDAPDATGGHLGFAGTDVHVDNLTIKYWDGSVWQTDIVEKFEANASGQATDMLVHDEAGRD